jgi:hypothetical protein
MSIMATANTDSGRYGKLRWEHEIVPVSGRAIPVYKGEMFRTVRGNPAGMCVDVNIVNLHLVTIFPSCS